MTRIDSAQVISVNSESGSPAVATPLREVSPIQSDRFHSSDVLKETVKWVYDTMNVVLKYSSAWPHPGSLRKEDRDKIRCIASNLSDDASV
jgi:hypothetical protein